MKTKITGLVGFAWLFVLATQVSAVDTTITGGRMELLNKGETVLFTGGVELNRGIDRVLANQMKTNKQRDQVTAEGNVRLYRHVSSTETWEGSGDTGFYNTKQGAGYLLGRKTAQAHISHTEILSSTMTRVIHLYGDRIDFSRSPQQVIATGHVAGNTIDPETGDHFDFWADRALFDGDQHAVTLTGESQPIAIQTLQTGRRVIKGDKITYFHQSQRMISDGHAQAVFEDVKENRK